MDDLKLAVETLQYKAIALTPFFQYYEGDQPIRYAAERLREVFQSRQTRFTQNWCALVVDAVLDRLDLPQFAMGDDDAEADELNTIYTKTGLNRDAEAIARSVLIAGESYVVAWRDGADIEAYYHDPRVCHVWYEAERPKVKRFAAKWWQDDNDKWWLNLFYADRVERYAGNVGDLGNAASFKLDSVEANPFGVVPVFHFVRDRHLIQSTLTNVVPIQDAINKLLGDMMIAAEFGAFRQRWAITNADTSQLRNAPNEIWELPAAQAGEQPTTVGEFATTDLANYLNAIDRLSASIGVITQTPRHYFFQQGGDPSGEALIAMEAPLNRKVERYQAALGATWKELCAFLLNVQDGNDVTPLWEPAETIQPLTQAQIRQLGVAAGMPLTTILRDEGWTAADLEQLQADKDEESQQQQATLAGAMMRAQQQFDAGEVE
jgi:hypothetical protein